MRSVGIVGGGTMGCGIAMNFANAGIPTVLVETRQQALEAAMQSLRESYAASAAKGNIVAG